MIWRNEKRNTGGQRRRGCLSRFFVLFAALLAALFFVLAGVTVWPWNVAPPAQPASPGLVYVTDYGRHSRLAIQADRNRMLEYSFGDWRYYAEGDNTLWRGVVALTLPTEAGLGRRHLPLIEDEATFTQAAGAERSLRLVVERETIEELLRALHARYDANLATEIRSDWTGLTFVRDDRPYHLFQNSNHQTAEWLQTLGCDVRGVPILSNVRVRKSGDSPDESGMGENFR